MNFQEHRPEGFTGTGDTYLLKLMYNVQRIILKTQKKFKDRSLYLMQAKVEQLAIILVEFAEDLHNDIGIWRSLEKYNHDFFYDALPLFTTEESIEDRKMSRNRICYLLWGLYSEMDPDLILAPHHKDLNVLAENISEFLEQEFRNIPHDSGIKHFLNSKNDYGWDVKQKLVWLGCHSYLFRLCFQNYVKEQNGNSNISTIDDFVCQHATSWSGLGVIDILASLLDITGEQREDLRSWYERHFAYYRVLSIKSSTFKVLNLINDKTYKIRTCEVSSQFRTGMIIAGSLVPWDKEWYWSGTQSFFDELSEEKVQELKSEFLQQAPKMAYRYCDELAQKAIERNREQYKSFVDFHGDDLAIFPDGYSLSAAMQKHLRLQYESAPKDVVSEVMKKHNFKNPYPNLSLPQSFLECNNGIGLFFNPLEGQEMMQDFNDVINGFKKKGINLTEDEKDSIVDFIRSENISPNFVKKLAVLYGSRSMAASFLIKDITDNSYFMFLLRRYKGHFFRKRYPDLSFG